MTELAFHDTLPPLDGDPFHRHKDFYFEGTRGCETAYVRAPTIARLLEWSTSNHTYRAMRKACGYVYRPDEYEHSRTALYVNVEDLISFLFDYGKHGKTRRAHSVVEHLNAVLERTA